MVPQRPLPVQGREQRTREVQAWLQAQVLAQVLVLVLVQALVLVLVPVLVLVLVQALVQALVTQSQQQPPWRRAGERRSAIGLPWCWR